MINVKYGTVAIPIGMPRIFTSNIHIFPSSCVCLLAARIRYYHLDHSIIDNNKIVDRLVNERDNVYRVPTADEFQRQSRYNNNR